MNRNSPDGDELQEKVDALAERLHDIASYLTGIAAVVEGMNKGTADSLDIAIQAIRAVRDDLYSVCEADPDLDQLGSVMEIRAAPTADSTID